MFYVQFSEYTPGHRILPSINIQVFEWDIVALANVTNNIFSALDGGVGGRVSVLILLDYSKAFDMINHNILSNWHLVLHRSCQCRIAFHKIISILKNSTGVIKWKLYAVVCYLRCHRTVFWAHFSITLYAHLVSLMIYSFMANGYHLSVIATINTILAELTCGAIAKVLLTRVYS